MYIALRICGGHIIALPAILSVPICVRNFKLMLFYCDSYCSVPICVRNFKLMLFYCDSYCMGLQLHVRTYTYLQVFDANAP